MTQEKLSILFVEDHKALLDNLAEYFSEDRYDPDFASDGLTALHLLANNQYDVIVLDVILPGVNGIDICKRIRQDMTSNTPILLLTALDAIENKEAGYGAGADDYLAKPFDMRELQLRIESLARRSKTAATQLTADTLKFSPGTLVVSSVDGHSTELSGLSASLFELLIRNHPNFVSYEAISNQLWGLEDAGDHTIRTHVYMLRKTLKQVFGKSMIKALYGRGYQLDINQE
ncbi:MAG: response regulator transcription factor [Ketobacter sp.]|nr:response regulator transcription factor [Ketobacter sp.]